MCLPRETITIVALVLAFAIAAAVPAHAEQRMVSVNGVWLGPTELALADRNAGYRVPNGYHWYDVPSGYWGLVGGPVLDRLSRRKAPAARRVGIRLVPEDTAGATDPAHISRPADRGRRHDR